MANCSHGDGVTVQLNGVPVDACVYEEIQTFRHVTVHVFRCVRCGHIDIEWERQEDTEEITYDCV